MNHDVLHPGGTTGAMVREAIEALPWRSALPADGMPAHQYVILGKCPVEAWDRLAAVIRDHPDSYDAFFRGYPWPMHYWEFEGHRYWRTSAGRTTHMLNRCTLDSVEPPRRVSDGATPAPAWSGPPWAPDGMPWPPGYVPGPGPRHYRGMVYRAELDPRADFPCAGCGITYWLYEPARPCPRCGTAPTRNEIESRGLDTHVERPHAPALRLNSTPARARRPRAHHRRGVRPSTRRRPGSAGHSTQARHTPTERSLDGPAP